MPYRIAGIDVHKKMLAAFYRDAIARVRELPGVEAASVGGPPPLASVHSTLRFWRSGDRQGASSIGMQQSIMPGYFGVMGIPLPAGRDTSDEDIIHGRRVAVVDERLEKQLWQGDAIGPAQSFVRCDDRAVARAWYRRDHGDLFAGRSGHPPRAPGCP